MSELINDSVHDVDCAILINARHSCSCERSRMQATIAKQREVIEELMDELKSAVTQFGCNCGHPACRGCRETKETWATICKAEEVLK